MERFEQNASHTDKTRPARELRKGVFWYIEVWLVTVSAACDVCGNSAEDVAFSSKSGENFNHKGEWEKLPKSVTGGRAYNHFPRGRVEIKNGRADIWLTPDLNCENVLNAVRREFGLERDDIKIAVRPDNSRHYRHGENAESAASVSKKEVDPFV